MKHYYLQIICIFLSIASFSEAEDYKMDLFSDIDKNEQRASVFQVYIIIDDAGEELDDIMPFLKLPTPLTIAVLPGLKDTLETVRLIEGSCNKQIILHQPMEPINHDIHPGPGAILINTPVEKIASILRENMAQVPVAKGMNNHMGSLVTQNRALMEATMDFCKTNNLFFIDSFTVSTSIAGKVACEKNVLTVQKHIFLDNDRNIETIRNQFEKGLQLAQKQGFVVLIGHAYSPETAQVIKELTIERHNQNYSFNMISDIFLLSQ